MDIENLKAQPQSGAAVSFYTDFFRAVLAFTFALQH